MEDRSHSSDKNPDLHTFTVEPKGGIRCDVKPVALVNLDDGDANQRRCMDTTDLPILISFPEDTLTEPNADLNSVASVDVTSMRLRPDDRF